jgi:ABC-2 type transport system ATP-binding protein
VALRIERLSKTYPNGIRAVDDVTLTIPVGMFGLLGPNGAGKSTLMRILATLQEADSGTAILEDPSGGAGKSIDVLKDKDAVRRTLGYLPQEFGLYPRAKAEDLLEHFAILKGITGKGERSDLVHSLLWQTNLLDARSRKLGTFSGGMRQRFGIAIALLGNPRLIIVDEPTAGLDPTERVRFLNLLSALGEKSVVILSTHIVEDVSELCSHMAIIDRGRIKLEAEPIAAIAALQGKIWRRLIERAQLPEYQQRLPVVSTRLLGGRTVVKVYGETMPEEGFEPAEPSLEDVYFAANLRAAAAGPSLRSG